MVKVVAVNEPVRLQTAYQEQVVHAGDIIMGDLNGVVRIPLHLLDHVLELIPPQVEADEKISEVLKTGEMDFTEAGARFRTEYQVNGQQYVKQEGQAGEAA